MHKGVKGMHMLERIRQAQKLIQEAREEARYMDRQLESQTMTPRQREGVQGLNEELGTAYRALLCAEADYGRTR